MTSPAEKESRDAFCKDLNFLCSKHGLYITGDPYARLRELEGRETSYRVFEDHWLYLDPNVRSKKTVEQEKSGGTDV